MQRNRTHRDPEADRHGPHPRLPQLDAAEQGAYPEERGCRDAGVIPSQARIDQGNPQAESQGHKRQPDRCRPVSHRLISFPIRLHAPSTKACPTNAGYRRRMSSACSGTVSGSASPPEHAALSETDSMKRVPITAQSVAKSPLQPSGATESQKPSFLRQGEPRAPLTSCCRR